MAQWIRFKRNYDHRWPSRAITAFKEGMIIFAKDEVADPAIGKGAAEETDRPEPGDPNHVTTRSPLESGAESAYASEDEAAPVPDSGRDKPVAEPHDVDDVGSRIRDRVSKPATQRQRT